MGVAGLKCVAITRPKRSQKSRYSTKILVLNLELGLKNTHKKLTLFSALKLHENCIPVPSVG